MTTEQTSRRDVLLGAAATAVISAPGKLLAVTDGNQKGSKGIPPARVLREVILGSIS